MADKKPRRVRLDWIPLDVAFPRGAKAVALGIATGNPLAWAHVVLLWTWAAENARDGQVLGPAAVGVIEHAAGWTGAPGTLVEAMALRHIRLLDQLSSGFAIHDWSEHTGRHITQAQANAENNAKRQEGYRKRNALHNAPVTGNGGASNGNREGEGEREEPTTTLPPPAAVERVDPRALMAEAKAAMPPPDSVADLPATFAVLRALHAAGKDTAGPARDPRTRRRDETLIAAAGVETSTARVLAAWNPAKPTLGWYSDEIAGPQAKTQKPRDIRRGMAPPSTDFTSKEATEL